MLAALAGVGIVSQVLQRQQEIDLKGKVVLITGGSRGLGLAIAGEFARAGAKLVLCSRDEDEMQRAQVKLEQMGAQVMVFPCDVTQPQEVERTVEQATTHFGGIDILVNNAGIISAGPLQTLTRKDFEDAMNIMFWGIYNMTMAVLPQMRERKSGRIVNITSIGGKVSVPHLLPYSSAKFAAVGFSEGLQSELARDGIRVTTVIPGLMRTGSHINTVMKGDEHRTEYTLFTLLDTLPGFSISAQRAAQYIVRGARRGSRHVIITLPAQLAARLNGALPEVVAPLLSLTASIIPSKNDKGKGSHQGRDSETPITRSFVTSLGQKPPRIITRIPPNKRVIRGKSQQKSALFC
ncbi:ketoacyl reductase [Dictyobacter sp. S3.2.2.5]|uniref:Ketoacyl reductase n=1 Tax=Dictyobacter halimunensis TaxID=3026934 RepID=A0ABQ6G448_9CHLR|nr:ketoacyl reductase [Dictyobacter sp. S3.2.2.5]